jgi:hypothetical protein
MYRMRSQLCDVFNCSEPELETQGILERFRAWLRDHPELQPCNDDPYRGEIINSDIAVKFFEACQQ